MKTLNANIEHFDLLWDAGQPLWAALGATDDKFEVCR